MIAGVKMRFALRPRALVFGATLLTLLATLGTAWASPAGAFTKGFADDVWFDRPADGVSAKTWMAKTQALGARTVQIEVDWPSVEPRAPRSVANAVSPSGPQYAFADLDSRVETIVDAGLTPVLLITEAPRWAEARGGTATEYSTGGYRPSAKAFGELGEALARRYSGSYPNPLAHGKKLPRVRYMQAWAEANTNFHLSPQWTRVGGRIVNSGANIYRGMLNAFYAGVKAGDAKAVVVASGLESYGDAPFSGLQRTHPVTFLEDLMCLSATLQRRKCPGDAVHFDVLASDPYEAFSPVTPAISPLDASAPDLSRLTKVTRAGLAAHTLLPGGAKPLWVTEFGYDSNPPNPSAVSTATQAKWLEQAFYVFWHEGVSVVLWYLVRDQAPPYDLNYFSGVYFRDGKPKPAATAYRFPFVIARTTGQAVQAWGVAPAEGTVTVQMRSGGGWKTIRSLRARAGGVFEFTSSALARGAYRASVDGQNSLVWTY
jgi:hypothetical protein